MIEITDKDTGNKLVVDDKTSIRIELTNPIFEDEVQESSRSYQFTLPYQPNDHFFGMARRQNIAEIKSDYNVWLKVAGQNIAEGKLLYLGTKNDRYQARLQLGENTLNTSLGDTKLKDIVKGSASINPDNHPFLKYPTIYNPYFFGDFNQSFDGYLNYKRPNEVTYRDTLCPMLNIKYIVGLVALAAGYDVEGSFTTSNLYQNTLLYANHHVPKNGSIDISELVPEMGANEFLTLVKKTFALHFSTTNGKLGIQSRWDIANQAPTIDLTGKIRETADPYKGFLFELKHKNENNLKVENDVILQGAGWDNEPKQIGTGSKQNIEFTTTPLATNNGLLVDSVVGASQLFPDLKKDDIPIRFLHHLGGMASENINLEKLLENWNYLRLIADQLRVDGILTTNLLDFVNLNSTQVIRYKQRDYLMRKLSAILRNGLNPQEIKCKIELVRLNF